MKSYLKKQVEKMLKGKIDIDAYLRVVEKMDFGNLTEISDDPITFIANNYYKLINFVLKRMKLRKFDGITFNKDEFGSINITVNNGKKQFTIDFDSFISHDDLEQTELLMEISCIWSDCLTEKVIVLLENSDWSAL